MFKHINKKEVIFFVKQMEVFQLRFTKSGRIICLNPTNDEWETIDMQDFMGLLNEWYIKRKRTFSKKGAKLEATIKEFIEIGLDVVANLDKKNELELVLVQDSIMDTRKENHHGNIG